MSSENVKRLPDAYKKGSESNNSKLLELQELGFADVRQDLSDLYDSLDIENAYGKTLDLFGDIVDQKRGALNDVQYRYMIYAKIGSNMSKCDHNSVMDTVLKMFNANAGDISLEDVSIEETDKSCVVHLAKMPLDTLVAAGFTSKQAVEMIKMVLPICVTVIADNFEGTFEFSGTADEYDEDAGFADEQGTIGGYLGLFYGEDEEVPLPIL